MNANLAYQPSLYDPPVGVTGCARERRRVELPFATPGLPCP